MHGWILTLGRKMGTSIFHQHPNGIITKPKGDIIPAKKPYKCQIILPTLSLVDMFGRNDDQC